MKLISNFNNFKPCKEKLLYHCVWFGELLDHHILCLASLFSTQLNSSVILWTDNNSYKSLSKLCRVFINYDFNIKIGNWNENVGYDTLAFRSDKWRLQILRDFGGIYFDLDIVFLKDISWFTNYGRAIVHEGYTSDMVFNNAIMYFPKNHSGLIYWLSRIGDGHVGWNTVFEIQRMSDNNFEADMIPNSVTDRGWTNLGPSFDDFFDNPELSPDILCESFLYHWHNRWHKSIKKSGTLAEYFWNKFVVQNEELEITR